MSCGLTDLTGCIGDVVGSAVSSVWDNICKSFGDAATSMLQAFGNAFASPNTDAVNLSSDGVHSVYAISLAIAGVVAALLLLFQVLRTVWTHEGNALAQGLVGVGKAALAFLLTIGVTTAGVQAADYISEYIVKQGFGTDAGLGQKLGALFAGDLTSAPTLLMLMALLGIIITVILWFELLMRAAAITILVATSPIAAAGQINDSTKSWWSKLVSATTQLIILKPIIALVFMLGFQISTQSTGIQETLAGLLILLLAVFAWPSVARFFAFASVAVGGGAGLGGLLGFASGRASAMANASGGGGGGGGSTTDFSQSAEARTTAAKSALGMGTGAGGSGTAGAGADAAKQGAMKAAMGKASTALAAAGPVGIALAGAKAAQGAINAVSGRMEQMAGHAGMSPANPYHQAAGSIPQQSQRTGQQPGGGEQRTNRTIAEQQNSSRPTNPPDGPPNDSRGSAGTTQAERDRPEPTPPGTSYESEETSERAESATGPGDEMAPVQQETSSPADYADEQTPPEPPASQGATPSAAPAAAQPFTAQVPAQQVPQRAQQAEAAVPQQGPPPAVEAEQPASQGKAPSATSGAAQAPPQQAAQRPEPAETAVPQQDPPPTAQPRTVQAQPQQAGQRTQQAEGAAPQQGPPPTAQPRTTDANPQGKEKD
ncbi:MAG TPA: conjugal transfer protein TrbL family protein [Actinocrinis sp.]|nr:conjugal transfer protein TrbL family protein [Actinocrinis sp.]